MTEFSFFYEKLTLIKFYMQGIQWHNLEKTWHEFKWNWPKIQTESFFQLMKFE